MTMKRYDNGEPITKVAIELEPWYPDYQAVMELAVRIEHSDDVDVLYEAFLTDYRDVFKKEYPNKEQALRWAVLHARLAFEFNRACEVEGVKDVVTMTKEEVKRVSGLLHPTSTKEKAD